MNKSTYCLKLRWPTLATLALCTCLPGCPFTDDYFIGGSSAGAGQSLGTGGAYEYNAGGALTATGGLDDGEHCSCPSGGQSYAAGSTSGHAGRGSANFAGSADAGASGEDAGSGNDAGSPGTSAGGTGGGNVATAGTANGGAVGIAGGPNLPQPACADGVIKNAACNAGSAQLCYKSCGPDNVGFKSETCQSGSYAEGDCTFPSGIDYSCYQIPPSLPEACPSGVPRGGRPCQVATCTVCFGGSTFAPQYQDSAGVPKQGYCVCSDVGTWTCGSTMSGSWPCPGPGCTN